MTLELQKQQQQTAKHSKVHLNISSKYKVIIFYPEEKVKIQNCVSHETVTQKLKFKVN